MDDQPTERGPLTDRERVADEQGREHTGGLGEREGAGTTGGAPAGPDEEEPEEDAFGPSRAERRGLGDIGRFGDEAATGEVGAEVESLTAEGVDQFADADLGASPPIGPDEFESRAAPRSVDSSGEGD